MTVIEASILAVVGSVSVWKALRHLAPAVATAMQSRLAAVLTRPATPDLLRRYGLWLRPVVADKPSNGCGSGCSACSGCTLATPSDGAQPLVFRRIEPPVPRR